MSLTETHRSERRSRERAVTRAAILNAARRVAARDGARDLSLRGVAAEAGYAPAALYGYFRNKDELLMALAAEDLGQVARAMRDAVHNTDGEGRLAAAASAALRILQTAEPIAAAQGALPSTAGTSEAERVFNGRLIAVLTALSDATGHRAESRDEQADVVLMASALAGLALLVRSGRLSALGFSSDEVLRRLDARFANRA
ncbi:MAG: TetR family transcriptional regulator [Proteobacteria bacterium]|nr:TetR family transcriptional regulator [Pseudomonadota bacterium]